MLLFYLGVFVWMAILLVLVSILNSFIDFRLFVGLVMVCVFCFVVVVYDCLLVCFVCVGYLFVCLRVGILWACLLLCVMVGLGVCLTLVVLGGLVCVGDCCLLYNLIVDGLWLIVCICFVFWILIVCL